MTKPESTPTPAYLNMPEPLQCMLTEEDNVRQLRQMLRSWFLAYVIQVNEGSTNEHTIQMNVWAYELLDSYLDTILMAMTN